MNCERRLPSSTHALASLPATPERARVLQRCCPAVDADRPASRPAAARPPGRTLQTGRPGGDCPQCVVDLAPMAFASGYEMAFEPIGRNDCLRTGDRAAIERAVTSLVQNAIEHGGNAGKITISVTRPAVIEVLDEGEGVPVGRAGEDLPALLPATAAGSWRRARPQSRARDHATAWRTDRGAGRPSPRRLLQDDVSAPTRRQDRRWSSHTRR